MTILENMIIRFLFAAHMVVRMGMRRRGDPWMPLLVYWEPGKYIFCSLRIAAPLVHMQWLFHSLSNLYYWWLSLNYIFRYFCISLLCAAKKYCPHSAKILLTVHYQYYFNIPREYWVLTVLSPKSTMSILCLLVTCYVDFCTDSCFLALLIASTNVRDW